MNQTLAAQAPSANPLRVKIAGMDCGSCAMTIENSMRQLPGVQSVSVSFTTESMELTGNTPLGAIEQRLKELGYRIATDTPAAAAAASAELHGAAGFLRFIWGQRRLRTGLLMSILVLAGMPLLSGGVTIFGFSALDLLFIHATVIAGIPVLLKGLRALIFARRINIDLLMAVASVGALGIGEYGEAVTVILLYTLGEALEAYSAEKARGSLRSLMSLQPQEAIVLREHHGGHGEHDNHGDHDDHETHAGHDHGHGHDHAREHAHETHAGHGRAHEAGHSCAGHDHDHPAHHDHDEARGGCGHAGHDHDHHASHDNHDHHGHDHAHHGSHEHGNHHGDNHRDHNDPKKDKETTAVHFHQTAVPVADVRVGETVLVRPGQRIPVDGVVTGGESSVNQAAVTGESDPIARQPGDEVMAGTVNGEGALQIRVTRPAGDATIARIARLVEEAQSKRSPAERFIDRFARWYTPAVVVLACTMIAVPVLLFGQPLFDTADGTHGWLYRGLALLIIACPCALVISIPVTVVSSLTRLANLGVLVKGGAQLDQLADVRAVAFDKTGTLTHGRPHVTAVRAEDCAHPERPVGDCEHCEDVVALAASVERASEHPVAHAIVSAAAARDLQHRYETAGAVTAHAGRGVTGELGNGVRIAVGNSALVGADEEDPGRLASEIRGVREAGNTVMYVARNDRVIGFIGVQDEVREVSRGALQELHASSPPVAAVMLTGDTPQAAARVAARLGHIDDVRAGLLPEEKLRAIEELHQRYGTVAMVGDGINDAPALARADVGIAMGAGTAQAMETADVVLMQDDLSHVPMALRVARRSRTLIKQNIALSLGLKLAFLALAIPGIATMWMAVLADVGATLLVTLNGMRVLRDH